MVTQCGSIMQASYPQSSFNGQFESPTIPPAFFCKNARCNGYHFTDQSSLANNSFFTPYPHDPQSQYQAPHETQVQGNHNRTFNGTITYWFLIKQSPAGIPVQGTFTQIPMKNSGCTKPANVCSPQIPQWPRPDPRCQQPVQNRFSPYSQVIKPLPVLSVDEVEKFLREIEEQPLIKRGKSEHETFNNKYFPPQHSSAPQLQGNHTMMMKKQLQLMALKRTAPLTGPLLNNLKQIANSVEEGRVIRYVKSKKELLEILKK
ncbi:hypothetical protein DICVIV_13125 [Dictyocaulus viviparus]|uniref:Uncharacterized protein n=1 Tax=Dictyocaulus viviparus TaxID=29172 RepID=A0A0D8X8N7_DICVI|nr:hypothetical protein DICVIV_13125 [Dictyocaulus viviparus]